MLAVPVPPPARMAPRRAILFIALVCLCAALVSGPATAQEEVPSPTPSVTSAATLCGPRVRRGWATLTTPEKQLYLDAMMKAMSTGLHTLFHEVHTDNDSGSEAHLTCGMIYWHRRFLLAYENMLRSLEPRFACLTIPYWDYFADFAKRSAGYCTSLEGCSTFLMELGGSIGPVETCTLGGNTITSNCVTSGLPSGTTITFTNITHSYNYTVETHFNMSGFCESSAMTPANCSRCVPRGNWTTAAFPSGFGYGTLARAVSASFGFQTFAQSLHYGVHNSIHNAAGSTMATLSTSADPIFYNFHAMGDLSHQLWYDCQVKRPMTEYEKKNSNYAYATCSQSTSVTAPSRLANITQYWSSNGTNRIRADDHPVLGKFFAPLPIEYWQFVSGTDLGDYSYSYANDGMLQSFADAKAAISCPATSKARRTEQMFGFLPLSPIRTSRDTLRTEALKRTTALWDGLTTTIINKISKPPSVPPTSAPTPTPTLAPLTLISRLSPTPAPTPTPTVTPQPSTAAPVPADVSYDAYMKVLDQMALMECAWYVEQGGFIVDWTDDFKRNMKMPADAHSPEYTLIMKLISGELKIELDNWRDIFKAYLQVDGTTQTTKLSPSGVKQPLGLEAVLDTSSASSISPGSLTEEAGVFIENQGTSAADTGIVMIPATLLEDV